MITCPNKNLPKWQELKQLVPDLAYTIWDLNDGNGIDKAPNGAESILFKSLLKHYNGDRNTAIQSKAKIYSNEFKEWFGDWVKAANANRVSLGKEIPNTDKYSKYGQKGETDIEIREVLNKKGNVIGTVRMEFSGKNRKGVVTLHPNLTVTGKGYGTALYQHIADKYNINVEESFGEIGKSEAAKRMWDRIYNAVSKDPDTPLRQLTPSNVSKVVDENGEPLVVFHGTDDYGFDTFDAEKSDDKLSFFTTNSKYIASTYTKFQPFISRQLRKYLIDNGAVELLKEGKYREFEKLFNTYYHNEGTIEQQIFNYQDYEEYNRIQKELQDPNLSETDYNALMSELNDLDASLRKHRYSIHVEEFENDKDLLDEEPEKYPFFKIYDEVLHEQSGPFIEKGVLFEGELNDLIDSLSIEDKVYGLFLNIKNPLIIDEQTNEYGGGQYWNTLDEEYGKRTRQV